MSSAFLKKRLNPMTAATITRRMTSFGTCTAPLFLPIDFARPRSLVTSCGDSSSARTLVPSPACAYMPRRNARSPVV